MEKKLPIFKLVIDDESELGVDYVALVNNPAIERNWIAFSDERFKFQVSDKEKRIVSGPLMVADLPIYRRDEKMGEYYAVFDADTIYKIVQRYFKNGFTSNVNIMHKPELKIDGVFMFESFIIDRERGVRAPKGFDGLTDGSWFGSYKVENEEVWQEYIKTGELKGFSVEGVFSHKPYEQAPKSDIEQLIEEINKIVR